LSNDTGQSPAFEARRDLEIADARRATFDALQPNDVVTESVYVSGVTTFRKKPSNTQQSGPAFSPIRVGGVLFRSGVLQVRVVEIRPQ